MPKLAANLTMLFTEHEFWGYGGIAADGTPRAPGFAASNISFLTRTIQSRSGLPSKPGV